MTPTSLAMKSRITTRLLAASCLSVGAALTIPNAAALGITSPTTGATLTPGASVTVTWNGGVAGEMVNLFLHDTDQWQSLVPLNSAPLPNTGAKTFTWTFPVNRPCNRRYHFYVENTTRTDWGYGGSFRLKCDIKAVKTKVPLGGGGTDYRYTITLINNGPTPIVPLPNPSGQQTRNVPVFRLVDAPQNGTTLLLPMGTTGAGIWESPVSPSPPFPVSTGQTFDISFRLNTATTIPPGGDIASYSFHGRTTGAATPKNCVPWIAMYRSDKLLGPTFIETIPDAAPANNTTCIN